jgi:hygromycin-B 7''-O-kinase
MSAAPALPRLPDVADLESYQRLWCQDHLWEGAVRAIAARHDLHETPVRYRSGTAIAFRVGDAVLKLYPPIARGDAEIETFVLNRLADNAAIPSARPLATARLGEWSYLLMSHLSGTPIEEIWATQGSDQRLALARQTGAMARALHQVSGADIPRLDSSWPEFRTMSRARAQARHIELGLPGERSAELGALLSELDRDPELEQPHVLLHTELGPGHLLIETAQVTGLIDFAEARAGLAEYDFAAVGIFVTRGDKAAFTAFLDAYGYPLEQRGEPLVRRLMRHALLHEYGHLSFYLRTSPVPDPSNLWTAADHWFGHVH